MNVLRDLRGSLAYFGVMFVLGMVISSLGPTLPYLAEDLETSLSSAGILFSTRSLGYMLGALLLGRAFDRLPGNRLLMSWLFLIALVCVLIPISPVLLLTAMLLFVSGICLSGMDVGSNTLVMWKNGARSGTILNGLFLFGSLGGFFVPMIVGGFVSVGYNIHWVYWLLAVLVLPIAIWIRSIPSPEPPDDTSEDSSFRLDFRLIGIFGALFFFYVSIEASFIGWIYSYMLSISQSQITLAASITSLFWGALAIGRVIAIPLAGRLKPFTISRINMMGALLSIALILISPNSVVAVAVGTFGLGLSMASSLPTMFSLARTVMPISGRLTGILWSFGSVGAMITPWMIGQLMERYGTEAMMRTLFLYILLAVMVLGLLWAFTARKGIGDAHQRLEVESIIK